MTGLPISIPSKKVKMNSLFIDDSEEEEDKEKDSQRSKNSTKKYANFVIFLQSIGRTML